MHVCLFKIASYIKCSTLRSSEKRFVMNTVITNEYNSFAYQMFNLKLFVYELINIRLYAYNWSKLKIWKVKARLKLIAVGTKISLFIRSGNLETPNKMKFR